MANDPMREFTSDIAERILFLNNRMKQITQSRSWKIDVIIYLKIRRTKGIPFGHKMLAGLMLLVIPENDENLEDTPLLPLLLLSPQVINCL